jgi:Icc-related predicted phosphoesterase
MVILALTDLRGRREYLAGLPEVCRSTGAEAVVFAGNITDGGARLAEWRQARAESRTAHRQNPAAAVQEQTDIALYKAFYDVMGQLQIPVFTVPGHLDAPERLYLQAVLNHETIAPQIYLVHRSFAEIGSSFVVSGFGGLLTDGVRETVFVLEYPAWEAEFAFDFLYRLERPRIMVFHTPPQAEKVDLEDNRHVGHPIVNTLIKTFAPTFAFCGHALDGRGQKIIGDTLVINPGPMALGDYAVLDTRMHDVFFGNLR